MIFRSILGAGLLVASLLGGGAGVSHKHMAAETTAPTPHADSLPTCTPDNRLCVLIGNFEDQPVGEPPEGWYTNKDRSLIPADENTLREGSRMIQTREHEGNRFVRMEMNDYAYRLIRVTKDSIDWSVSRHPVLRWDWRVLDYPENARETDDGRNDSAAAVYVTFGRDWLGRPKSIKYTYSSTLPVGTTTSSGPLRVMVVASAAEQPVGEWLSMERNVLEDYRTLFGEDPDTRRPTAITLFSDADSVPNASATVDFDNVAAWYAGVQQR